MNADEALSKCLADEVFGYGVTKRHDNGVVSLHFARGLEEIWDPINNHMHAALLEHWLIKRGNLSVVTMIIDNVMTPMVKYHANNANSEIPTYFEQPFDGSMRDMRQARLEVAKLSFRRRLENIMSPRPKKRDIDLIKVDDIIEFKSDAQTDKGPCSGTVVAVDDTLVTFNMSDTGPKGISFAKGDLQVDHFILNHREERTFWLFK